MSFGEPKKQSNSLTDGLIVSELAQQFLNVQSQHHQSPSVPGLDQSFADTKAPCGVRPDTCQLNTGYLPDTGHVQVPSGRYVFGRLELASCSQLELRRLMVPVGPGEGKRRPPTPPPSEVSICSDFPCGRRRSLGPNSRCLWIQAVLDSLCPGFTV